MTMTDFLNKVVFFLYHGGTTEGMTRRVFVTDVSNNEFGDWTIKGWDFDRGNFRQFRFHKMENLRFVDDAIILTDLPELVFDQITVEPFEEKGLDCHFHRESGTFVACPKAKPYVVSVRGNQNGLIVDFIHSTGPSLSLKLGPNGEFKVDGVDRSIEEFSEDLAVFVQENH